MKNILNLILSFFITFTVASAQYDYDFDNYDFGVTSYEYDTVIDDVVVDVLVDGQNVGGCGDDVVNGVTFEIEEDPFALPFVPPLEVPFGVLARMKAMSSVTGYDMEVSIGGKSLATTAGYFGPIKAGMADIEKGLAKAKLFYIVEDPRRQIMLETRLVNSLGEEVLYSQNNFKLIKSQTPESAKHLYFWFRNGLWVDVPGAENATVLDAKGLSETLLVENGWIFLPEWVLNNHTQWDTLRVQFTGGMIQKYDHTGKQVRLTLASGQVKGVNVDGFERGTVQNGLCQSSNFGYWWNPIVELTNPVKGFVTLDIKRDGDWWNRPTSVFITTPEDLQQGLGWKVVYDYDPKNDETITESITIPMDAKVYYLHFEWDDSSGKG